MSRPPICLTIAGSDSGGGAGIQADLKTFAALGVYGCSVITAVTAQNSLGVYAVQPIDPEVVVAQIDAVLEDFDVGAIKIGMLATAPVVRVVADRLAVHQPPHIVLDPVMIAGSGDPLIEPPAVEAIRDLLIPLAEVVTPNVPEAEALGSGLKGCSVLFKGGHGEGEDVVDVLRIEDSIREFVHPRQEMPHTHGTGCTLSAAITAHLAGGLALGKAVELSIGWLQQAIRSAYAVGRGPGPVNHLWEVKRG